MIDKSKLKELALAANVSGCDGFARNKMIPFHAVANPAAILELLAELESARNAALEEAAEKLESMNDSAGDRASYDNRDMTCCEAERMHALMQAVEAIRSIATTTSTEPTAPSASASPADTAEDDLPPLTMSVYGTRTNLELERQRRADIAARAAHVAAPVAGSQQVPDSQAKATHEQALAGYAVACKFGVYEARAFNLADEMFAAFAAAAPAVPVPAEQDERREQTYRQFVEDWATKAGWDAASGEGAFEYVQRISYEQGFADQNRKPEYARQPVSEGLRLTKAEMDAVVYACKRAPADANHDVLNSAVRTLQAWAAVPPAKAEGLSDEQIDAAWDSLDGEAIIKDENHLNWNRALRRAFARAILAQQAKGEKQ